MSPSVSAHTDCYASLKANIEDVQFKEDFF